ncbi:MAG: 2OG-Fe(II) oxygenase [Halieaceae bacterium]|jgi:PKHD-type hydroxylase|nr:2OG-Fe(II) oxygenase [Halieaceae bacterium]
MASKKKPRKKKPGNPVSKQVLQQQLLAKSRPATEVEGFDRQVTVERCFTDEEMDALIQAAEEDFRDATVGGQNSNPEIRISQVHWLDRDKYAWAYEKVWRAIQEVNASSYGFDITGFEGRMQVTRYDGKKKGHYTWHMDGGQATANRKISLSVQLSHSEDYKGGDIGFFYTHKERFASRERGAIVTFPSWVMHRVNPVKRGVRYSLIAWIVGPRWR